MKPHKENAISGVPGGASQLPGLSRYAVLKLIELGFVTPLRQEGGGWKFSFQDAVLLRSAQELRAARIPTRQILHALRQLKARLPDQMPLPGMRITATGDRVTVRSANAHWEPATGQMVLDLQVAVDGGSVSAWPPRGEQGAAHSGGGPADTESRFAEAEALEETDPAAAEALYRQLLADDPSCAYAYLNLGFMLCESGRYEAAATLYAEGLRVCPEDPLMHFNRAVALHEAGHVAPALEAYEAALRLQPDLADAHRNAALLYADSGNQRMAIRHFSAFKRLQARGAGEA